MTNVSYGIASSTDDVGDYNGAFLNSNIVVLGNSTAPRIFGLRFVGVAVPQGATITSATLTVKRSFAPSGTSFGLGRGVASDNAPDWTTTRPLSATKTTASFTVVETDANYNVTAIVQEIVSRSGWVAGNALAFAGDPTGANGELQWVDYATSPTDAAQLSITYEAGGSDVTPPTITSSASLSVKEGAALSHTLTANETVTWTKVGGANATAFTLTGANLSLPAQTYPSGPFEVVVRATDAAGNWSEQTITVTVREVPFAFVAAAGGTTKAVLPAHQAGDLLVSFMFRDGSATAPALPSGWTSWGTGAGTSCSYRLAYKIAASSSESGGAPSTATTCITSVYRPKTGFALLAGALAQAFGTAATLSYPALTLQTTDGSSWVGAAAGHRSTNTAIETPPAGMVLRNNTLDATDEAAVFDTNGGVTSWAAANVELGGTASGWAAVVFEIKAVVSGLPTITGTASAALAALTLSASGTVLPVITGAASATLGVLTASGAGAAPVTGQRSGALSSLTASAAGDSAVTGQASRTLAALTLAASGSTVITGDASAIIEALTVSAVGEAVTPGTDGAANLALASLTLTASGGPTITGVGSAQIGPMTLVAVGAPETAGQGSLAVAGLTVSADGSSAVTGQISGLLAPMAVEAEGESAVTGAGSGFFSATAAAVGVSAISGAASALLGQLTVDAFGAAGPPPIEGSASIALASLTVVAYGGPIVSGESGASVSFSADAAGASTIIGAGTGVITLSASSSGSSAITGAASASIAAEVEAEGEPIVSGAASLALGAIQAEAEGETTVVGVALAQIEPLTLTAEGVVRNLRVGRRLVIVVG